MRGPARSALRERRYGGALARREQLPYALGEAGHGGLLEHRAERLDQVRAAVEAGATTPREVVETVYHDVGRHLWPAAEQSVAAQLDYLRG